MTPRAGAAVPMTPRAGVAVPMTPPGPPPDALESRLHVLESNQAGHRLHMLESNQAALGHVVEGVRRDVLGLHQRINGLELQWQRDVAEFRNVVDDNETEVRNVVHHIELQLWRDLEEVRSVVDDMDNRLNQASSAATTARAAARTTRTERRNLRRRLWNGSWSRMR